MKKIYIFPVDGREVRDPRTKKLIPESGAWVPRDGYWLKRMRDGDVSETQQEARTPTLEETLRAKTVAQLKDYAREKGVELKGKNKDAIIAELLEAAVKADTDDDPEKKDGDE